MDRAEPPVITTEIRHLLARDYAAVDPELGRAIHLLAGRNAAVSWHKHGVFLDHLIGTYRILRLWGEPRATCLCGLFHSVYANEYVDLALFNARTERGVLADAMGREVEDLVYILCLMPRTEFALRMLDDKTAIDRGMTLRDPQGGASWELPAETVRAFLAVTIADFAEQWFDWQDQVMDSYPHTEERRHSAEHWTKALWPGSLRPSATNMSLMSRLARRLPEFAAPLPPIFDRCSQVLSPEDEAAATDLYWRVAGGGPMPESIGRAADMLGEAVARNPWMPEPHLHLAQLELLDGNFSAAGEHALRGLRLLLEWGTPCDKRIPWEGWVAWSRVLLKGAREHRWPQTLRALNNLGLVE